MSDDAWLTEKLRTPANCGDDAFVAALAERVRKARRLRDLRRFALAGAALLICGGLATSVVMLATAAMALLSPVGTLIAWAPMVVVGGLAVGLMREAVLSIARR